MKENNGLIKSENSIIKKVINFFKNMFFKNKLKEIKKQEDFVIKKESMSTEEKTSLDRLLSQNELESKLKTEDELLEESNVEYEPWEEEIYEQVSTESFLNNSNCEIDMTTEKKRILELYRNIKEGSVSVESVDVLDLMMINPLLQEEVKLKNKIIKKQILVNKNS